MSRVNPVQPVAALEVDDRPLHPWWCRCEACEEAKQDRYEDQLYDAWADR